MISIKTFNIMVKPFDTDSDDAIQCDMDCTTADKTANKCCVYSEIQII
jgi:hypothetical protein